MHTISKLLLIFALFYVGAQSLSAQDTDAPTSYHIHDYFHVAPGDHADYRAVEKVWKKLHLANIKAGKYVFWELTEIAIGGDTDYNYVTRIMVEGEEQLAAILSGEAFQANPTSILSPAEKAVLSHTGDTRSFVKREIYTVSSLQPAADFSKVKVAVHNHFNYPEGSNHRTHVKMEKDIWQPVHAARIKEGAMLGWVLADKVMPWGAGEPFHDVTVDLYQDLESYLKNSSPMPQFRKVHAGKNIDELMAKTSAAATLMSSEVRLILDNTNW